MTFDATGVGALDWLGNYMSYCKVSSTVSSAMSDDFMIRLTELLLEIARDPQGVSDLVLAGLWHTMACSLSSRPAVTVSLIEAGMIEVAIATLQESSPTEWVTWKTPIGARAAGLFALGWTMSTLELPMNKTQLLLDRGYIDVCISALKALELQGPRKVEEANVQGIFCCVQLLSTLDLTAPEAVPIVRQLKGMASTLRFVLDNSLSHMQGIGFTSAGPASAVCALAFGKEEGGDFEFTQTMIDSTLAGQLSIYSGTMAPFTPTLPPFFLRPVVHLCISDVNKALLIRSPDLMKLLIEALLLDPEHTRQDQLETTKGTLQHDAAECFMQLALYEPGRDVLQQSPGVLDALRMLVDKALTEEARKCAEGVLVALDPQVEAISGFCGDQFHVMMSYQWAVQKTVKRIVTELQRRGYAVWFDLECMKGSVSNTWHCVHLTLLVTWGY